MEAEGASVPSLPSILTVGYLGDNGVSLFVGPSKTGILVTL